MAGGLLGAIQGGFALKSAAERGDSGAGSGPPPPVDTRSSLLSAIKSGASLKSASERQMATLPPPPVDTRSSLLLAIKSGANLKKAVVVAKKEEVKTNAVLEIMQRRSAIAAESDSEESDGDWD